MREVNRNETGINHSVMRPKEGTRSACELSISWDSMSSIVLLFVMRLFAMLLFILLFMSDECTFR